MLLKEKKQPRKYFYKTKKRQKNINLGGESYENEVLPCLVCIDQTILQQSTWGKSGFSAKYASIGPHEN